MLKTLKAATSAAVILGGASMPSAANPILDIKPYAVTMSVPDMKATAQWYEATLGFKTVQTKSYPEFKTALTFMERDGFRIELIEDGNAKAGAIRANAPAHTATHGISQFSFQTPDLAKVKAQLSARSIATHFDFENAELGVRFFFIRDPNGNLIQFLQRL